MSESAADSIAADVGQLLWLGFDGSMPPDDLQRDIAAGRVGAVILFRRNLPMTTGAGTGAEIDIPALCALSDTLHRCAPDSGLPLWIAVDQEGGRVQRVRAPAPHWPAMLALGDGRVRPPDDKSADKGADNDADNGAGTGAGDSLADVAARCRLVGRAMGRELYALGFDVNFAPVLDVHTNEANPIIGDRAFGRTPERVAAAALAFVDGLHSAGILGCGKHFPGHGDTDTDSHLALPRLNHDMDRLRAVELVPFQRAVAAQIPLIMSAHVVFAALDARVPATLSRRVMTGLLREELGFAGIIVSDDLDMRAISAHFGIGGAAIDAVRAGCDALLLCRSRAHQRQAYDALTEAAANDSQLRARIAESAGRIRAAKQAHAARERPPADPDAAIRCFAEHRELLQSYR